MLVDLSIKEFAKKVASHEPVVPAGGCVMALSGLMGVCLLELSINSASGRSEGEKYEAFFKHAKRQLTKLHRDLLSYIERDAESYGGLLAAYKLPKSTQKEAEQRRAKIQITAVSSIEIPLKISKDGILALESGIVLLAKIKYGVLGDLKIGLLVLKTVVEGSLATAKTNLPLIKEEAIVAALQVRIDALQAKLNTVMTGLQ